MTESIEYKPKNSLPDLYHILGLTIDVCKDPKCNEIITKAYLKKAKACHPDKHSGRKDVEEVFELITSAYDILKDEQTRKEYNHKLSLHKQSSCDFSKLKKDAQDYLETIGEYKQATDQQKLDFKEKMKALDQKHGYNSSLLDAIPSGEARKKMDELLGTRREQDQIWKPQKLFDEGSFDLKKFNAAFDKVHNISETSLIPHNGIPSAWNDSGSTANFSNFDDLDNLYVDDGNRFDTSKQIYGSVDFETPIKNITKEELDNIQDADYVDGHNRLDDNYYADMKAKLRERKSDTKVFENMAYGDFKRDDTAGYGIFDQLRFKFDDRLELDIDDNDISKKYEKLMAERQKELLPGSQPSAPKQKKQPKNSR